MENNLQNYQKITKEQKQSIVSKYVEGYSIANVRRLINYSVSEHNIARILREAGVSIRSQKTTGKKIKLLLNGKYAKMR